jgi:hypothetical protein
VSAGALRLGELVERFRAWMHFPDPLPLYVVLAAVLANRMERGDPFWLVVLGGSSRGKTELLAALDALEHVYPVGDLTPAALLSGTPTKERAKGAKGGLLRRIPPHGAVLVVKDLGAVLAMPNEQRVRVLQALREVYDGLL